MYNHPLFEGHPTNYRAATGPNGPFARAPYTHEEHSLYLQHNDIRLPRGTITHPQRRKQIADSVRQSGSPVTLKPILRANESAHS